MNSLARVLARSHGALRLVVAAMAVISMLSALPSQARAQDAGSATITVTSTQEDGSTPLPFVRFQITDSNGNSYGPLETAPPDGSVTFTVDTDGATTYDVVAETPPACAVQPDPVTLGPLAAGDEENVSFEFSFIDDCDLGAISIYSYACPDGIDPNAADYATFSGNCVETVDGENYTISDEGGEEWEVVTGAYGISGRAPLVGLVPATYQIEDTDPAADTALVVFCLAFPVVPDGSDPDAVAQAEVNDDAISLPLDGERVACDFFAVPSAGGDDEQADDEEPVEEAPTEEPVDGGDGEVDELDDGDANDAVLEVHLSACPAGYEGADFFNDCHPNGIENQTVTLEGPDGYSDSMVTFLPASPGPGVAAFDGLASGDYKVSEDVPGDTATYYAYCSMADSDEIVPFEYDDSSSEAILLTLGESESVVCDFYVVPNEQVDEEEATEEPTEEPTEEATEEPTEEPTDEPDIENPVEESGADDATLEVHLSACPTGYGGGNFFEDCHDDGIENQTITIEGPDGFADSMQTILIGAPGDGPGIAAFEGLAAGDYKVSEDVPGDSVTYYAYCSMADSAEVVPFEYDDSTSEAIVFAIGESDDIVCDFYIVPDQQQVPTGEILITKYTCPVGYDSDAINNLLADCTEKTQGVTFTLTPHSGASEVDKTTGESGRVRFDELEPGNYDVSEDVPGEFSTPVVWCNVAGGEWYQKQISGSDTTTFDVDAGDDIRCAWFNLPEDLSGGGSLTIHKSICPPGLTSGYFATCYDDTLADVTFVADGPGGYEASLTTGNNGTVTFGDLNAGNYVVTELPPDSVNVNVYVVVCTRDGQTYNFNYDDSSGLRIVIRIPAGSDIVCDWYNVPPAQPQPGAEGSITVVKFLCQGRSDNEYDWEDDCESYGAGAEFALTRISNSTVTEGTTAANGRLVFANLANGAYALDETSGDWCHAEADLVDASGNVKVVDGDNTNVYIYNCDKPVNRLPSTGTGIGPAGQPGGIGGTMVIWGAGSILGLVLLRRVRQPRPIPAVVRRAA